MMENLQIFNRSTFNHYVRLANESGQRMKIAVIGNSGASEQDDDNIKDAHCVIRFNNFATRGGITHTSDPLTCDILVTTMDLHSKGCKPRDVVIGIPFPFNAESINSKMDRRYHESNVYMVHPYLNMEMCKEHGIESLGFKHPFPSVGYTLLWHLHKILHKLPNPIIYIGGFEWYYDDSTKLFQGYKAGKKEYPKTWNHCYPNEVRWVVNKLMNHSNYFFGDRQLQILNEARKQLNEATK